MAEVTYYFDVRGTSGWADPDNMIGGILTNYAYTSSDETAASLEGTTCDGTDLGTITKVELRVYGYGDGNDRIDLFYVYGNQYELTMTSSANWSSYADVTDDAGVGGWTWAKVKEKLSPALRAHFDKVGKGDTMYCAKVEIRVTYDEGAPPAYYHGLKVQGEGELALCDVVTNPLRIRKGGVTYGLELVAIDDPNASRIRIKTNAGVKAIRKYT